MNDALAASSSNALAISAPIHISGTGGEGLLGDIVGARSDQLDAALARAR